MSHAFGTWDYGGGRGEGWRSNAEWKVECVIFFYFIFLQGKARQGKGQGQGKRYPLSASCEAAAMNPAQIGATK